MKLTILMGSPRKNGNTQALLKPFMEELDRQGVEYEFFWIYDLDVHGCMACRTCQQDWEHYSCAFDDDLRPIYESLLRSDAMVLATPIYGWYCPGPMKNVLDRLIYCMCMYYGKEKGPALWAGKKMYILSTCGYRPEKGAYVFEEGMKMYCRHCALEYGGMHTERDLGYNTVFMDEDKAQRARAFAARIAQG
ncbi:MAG: flavodoxin family protein [Oscillibacter sp.]|nr:flavodoxin family protein [Oscillibacter sp.]